MKMLDPFPLQSEGWANPETEFFLGYQMAGRLRFTSGTHTSADLTPKTGENGSAL